ncbi:MAG: hypothetical protein BWY79_01262 [Actinobacteria bacterium ADurb.Bin444]|nr:MAG: hypothetical protein BWY79_01262 [Actinobacteria bacterium ADurb.Bin444]
MTVVTAGGTGVLVGVGSAIVGAAVGTAVGVAVGAAVGVPPPQADSARAKMTNNAVNCQYLG